MMQWVRSPQHGNLEDPFDRIETAADVRSLAPASPPLMIDSDRKQAQRCMYFRGSVLPSPFQIPHHR
jgi:hypothetical protein